MCYSKSVMVGRVSHMCSMCFSAGVSLDGQRTSPSLKTLELYHPSFTSARPSSCLIYSSPVDPRSAPSLSPAHPLSTGLAFACPLSARFICSSKRFHPPQLLCPISPFTWSKLCFNLIQHKCSAITLSLSLFSLLPEPLASPAPTGPSGPLVSISM